MKISRIANAIGHIDEDLITDTENRNQSKPPVWLKWTAIAACFCFLCVAAMIGIPRLFPNHTTLVDPPGENPNEAGGINGKINVTESIVLVGEDYSFSDKEAASYLNTVKAGIVNDLNASGIAVSNLVIKEEGYSHIRTGDDGNSMAVNWRDYLAYDQDELVAIVQVTKENAGMKHFLMFGGPWLSRYTDLLEEHKGQELAYIYIGDVDAFITPDNQIVPLIETDVSSAIEEDCTYYELLKTPYNTYTPE